ncbi:MAG: 2-(5''-triphosphoribosyl)-3'-dephosphocoenzyme-A synthase [Candidatus Dichloromethanomonas elyunquensis]|nr:MAG: 2-(5''-triphosphoribosyl)-3'-dephosphocoenzyme-A synthase [Candidatus Dichloromethanomonas elyunquensis]
MSDCISPAAWKIGEAALRGMLYEVGCYPSPGLVSPISSGLHTDMDFFTFLNSTAVLAPAMYRCAQIGLDEEENLLPKLRVIGQQTEREMFRATNKVNTQKGLLFLAGIVCASAGQCVRQGEKVIRQNIVGHCRRICKGIVGQELAAVSVDEQLSHGQRLYKEFGALGVRGEIADGLPSVIQVGLPLYEEALQGGLTARETVVHCLVGMMSRVEDTTVMHRSGLDGHHKMRKAGARFIQLGGMKTASGQKYLTFLKSFFIKNKISPGGAADLAAVTIMIYHLEKSNFSELHSKNR